MKAIGRLIHTKYTDKIKINDDLTIELPKGMRVIGTCSTCESYDKKADDLKCIVRQGFEYNPMKFGCIAWKARKK